MSSPERWGGNVGQLCTFNVEQLYVGIEVSCIQEILRFQPLTRVPLAPSPVRGLMSLRGQIVPVLDLRERLGLPAASDDQESFVVLIRTAEGPVSLVVDRVGDVVDVTEDIFEPVPETMQSQLRPFLHGAYKLEKSLLLSLNAHAAVSLH